MIKKKNKWLKEVFGLPTYITATIVLMGISDGDNLIIVYIGLIPFVIAYNMVFEYIFPEFEINKQWGKLFFLLFGQFVFWVFLLKLLEIL